jgi:alpha-glucosidase
VKIAHRCVLYLSIALPVAGQVNLASPDSHVRFELQPDENGNLEYTVTFDGETVIEPSPIGITVDGVNLGKGVEIGALERYQVNETYPWVGKHSTAVDHCNGIRISSTHRKSRTRYTLEVRAYNDGVAFRHIVPGSRTRVPDEATVFRLPARSRLWYHDLEDFYEGIYKRRRVTAAQSGSWAAPPITIALPNNAGYAAITEGGLRNYSGMALEADGQNGFHARLAHAHPITWIFRWDYKDKADEIRVTSPAAITGTITTPWRIVMVGADLDRLVNSDIVHNVAAPPDPKLFPNGPNTEWIKPGRAVWCWSDGGSRTLEGMKEFSRLAGELGFEYNVVEGFWSRWPESDVKELVDYSLEHGVRIILWSYSAPFQDPERLREFVAMCRRTGVAGVKLDAFNHEHKSVVDMYDEILRAAAENELIVDLHGVSKPAGQERTWPNEVGHEGIRGMESSPPWAQHDTTLPFTRMLAGLADYTPIHFGRKLGDTTWAHQAANAVILTAPLQVYSAHPANLLANPTVEMVKSIPSVWDETVVLPISEIGQVAAFARRQGETWFLAVTNGPNARTIGVDLSFLGEGSYQSHLIRDGVEAASVKTGHQTLRRDDSLHIKMPSGGGFIARFSK